MHINLHSLLPLQLSTLGLCESRLEWAKKPDALIKNPKSASKFKDADQNNIDWGSFKRSRVDALYLDFKKWLDQSIEKEPRVSICDDATDDDVSLWVNPDKGEEDLMLKNLGR